MVRKDKHKKAEELDIPIVFHTAIHPTDYSYSLLEKFGMVRSLGRLLDHTLAAVRVLYGVAKDFPRLKFLHGHFGGTFFPMKDKLLAAKLYRVEDQPYEEMFNRQFFFDTTPGWTNLSRLECAAEDLGVEHTLLGSDYPFMPHLLSDGAETIWQMRVSEGDTRKMLGENAAKLFKL